MGLTTGNEEHVASLFTYQRLSIKHGVTIVRSILPSIFRALRSSVTVFGALEASQEDSSFGRFGYSLQSGCHTLPWVLKYDFCRRFCAEFGDVLVIRAIGWFTTLKGESVWSSVTSVTFRPRRIRGMPKV